MAAACGSLEHIFKKPLPENPTLIESLSTWNQIKAPPTKPSLEDSSSSTALTEIFGELHFKEKPEPFSTSNDTPPFSSSSSPSSSASLSSMIYNEGITKNTPPSSDFFLPTSCQRKQYSKNSTDQRFPSTMNPESLQLCTEGLGFESSDDVEELANGTNSDWQKKNKEEIRSASLMITKGKHVVPENPSSEFIKKSFPPPISCIGMTGKPGVCFKPYRKNGRFVLKEMRIPTREYFLHACREDGRLKLQFFHSEEDGEEEEIPEEEEEIPEEEEEIPEEEEEEEDDDDDDDDDDESENDQY